MERNTIWFTDVPHLIHIQPPAKKHKRCPECKHRIVGKNHEDGAHHNHRVKVCGK